MQEYQGMKPTHSLRTTNATWLFDCDVDKRLIMERTGRLSCKGVRLHKHTVPLISNFTLAIARLNVALHVSYESRE